MLGIEDQPYRYDVVTVVLDEPPQIELLRNFWTPNPSRDSTD
jgi:hypothetical protein